MRVPDNILADLNDELKPNSDKEHRHQTQEHQKLQGQYQNRYLTIQTRSKRARELFLDTNISQKEYDHMMTNLQEGRHNIEVRLQKLSGAEDNFNKQVGTIFSLSVKSS